MRRILGMFVSTVVVAALVVPVTYGSAAGETVVTAPYTDGQVCYTAGSFPPSRRASDGQINNRMGGGCITASTTVGTPGGNVPEWSTVFARPAQNGQLFVGGNDHIWGDNIGVNADLYVFGNWRSATYQTFTPSADGVLTTVAHLSGAISADFERFVRVCLVVTQGTVSGQDCISNGAYSPKEPVRDLTVAGLTVTASAVSVVVFIETSRDLGAGHLVLEDLTFS